MVSINDVSEARALLEGIARKTYLDYSRTFSQLTGMNIYLKMENLQKTGSFKIRGAFNKIAHLSPEEREKGVIAASAGNHAQGVAYAASAAGIKSTIVMPKGAPISKITATKNYGAEVVLLGDNYDEAYQEALHLQSQKGGILVHAFDDPYIIAGQGTIGLEILEDLPQLDVVVVPVGGGGMISGIALAVKNFKPEVRVIGIQAEGAASMYKSRQKGRISELNSVRTIADGIAIKRPGKLTYELVKKYVDEVVMVSDEEIAEAVLMLLERSKVLCEGAGAVGLAACLNKKVDYPRKNVAVILSGGNIDVNMLSRIIERGLSKIGRYARIKTIITDRPGALQNLLALVAEARGNVISINHERILSHVPLQQAEVELTLETKDLQHINEIVSLLEENYYQAEVER